MKVVQVSEARTSQYCRKCYQKGARKIQGLFTCAKCGEENADRNAAFNIAYRALGYISKVGVTVNLPKLKLRTFASVDRNAMMTKEATYFNRR
ncbi:MAG: zinc ribbon domain-containing protein [Candidatus Nitrosopolaris sp.]